MTLRTLAALALTAGLTASVVLAAAPPQASLPKSAHDASPAVRDLKLKGWLTAAEIQGESAAMLTMVTQNGSLAVQVSSATVVRHSDDGTKMNAGDLTAALPVDVQGSLGDDAILRATIVSVGPLPATTATERLTLRGRIVATFPATTVTGQRRLFVMTSSRGEAVLEVDQATVIRNDGGKGFGFSDLRAGQSLQDVVAFGTTLAVARAASIVVSQSGSPPAVTVEGLLVARGDLPNRAKRWLVGDYIVRVPAELADAYSGLPLGTYVSITAKRSLDDGELQALKIRPVTKAARPQLVELRGQVKRWDRDGKVLQVDDTLLTLSANLVAPANLAVGDFVKVKAQLDSDGRLEAQLIEVLTPGRVLVQFEGSIDKIGSTEWMVAGVTVQVSPVTVLTGDAPGIASHAEVSGLQDAGGVVLASSIKVTSSLTPSSLQLEGRLLEAPAPPARWTVQGKDKLEVAVIVSEKTIIDENSRSAKTGAWVQVRGTRNGNDEVVAERIKVR
jgi:hypothetical protein